MIIPMVAMRGISDLYTTDFDHPVKLLVDFGATSIKMICCNAGQAVLAREINTGGSQIINSIYDGLKQSGTSAVAEVQLKNTVELSEILKDIGMTLLEDNSNQDNAYSDFSSAPEGTGYSAPDLSGYQAYNPEPRQGQAPVAGGQPQMAGGQPQMAQPIPVQGNGQPMAAQPVPMEQGQGQVDTGYGQPDMGYGQPDMGYGQAEMGYGQPQQGYAQPQQGYAQPDMGYGQPDMGYGQPDMGYGQPDMGYVPQGGAYGGYQQEEDNSQNMAYDTLMSKNINPVMYNQLVEKYYDEVISEVAATIDYCGQGSDRPTKIIYSGGIQNVKGFINRLQQAVGIECEPLDIAKHKSGSSYKIELPAGRELTPNYGVALGACIDVLE